MRKSQFIFTLMLGCSLATMAKAADTSYDNCVAAVGAANAANCVQIGTSGTYYALSGAANNQTMTIYGTTGDGSAASVPEKAFWNRGSTFPGGVTSLKTSGDVDIGNYAFYGATGLTSANLTGVQSIGNWAFQGATGLTSIDLTGVQTIGFDAFYEATGLTSIIIPDSLLDSSGNILGYAQRNGVYTGIDADAFSESGLQTIVCPAGKSCGINFGISGDNIISYSKENGKYVLADGTVIGTYQVATPSGPQPSQPSQPTKPQRADIRIYTIDEANAVAGKVNSVKIRYR